MNSLGPGPPATARRSPAISCAAVDVNLQALKLVLRTSSNTATHLALRQTSSALYREALNIVPWRKAQQHGRRCVCTALRAVVHQPADYLALSSSPRLLQQALEKHLEGDGSLTAQDVNLSVRGLCQVSPRWLDIWRCSQLAESAGILLETETYAELWKAAIKAGWVAHAAELFRRSAAVWGVPDQKAYTTAISLLLHVQPQRGMAHARLAYQLWRELFDAHKAALDGGSVRAGVDACAHAGKPQEAERLISWARERGIRPGLGAYNRLLAHYAESGDMQGARNVYRNLKERHTPDIITWNTLVAGYARVGDISRARAVIDDARRSGCQPDAWTWAALLNACAKAGDMPQAELVLQEMLKLQQAQQAAYAVASQAGAPDALLLAGGHPTLNGHSGSSAVHPTVNGKASSHWANEPSLSGSHAPKAAQPHPSRGSISPSSHSNGARVPPLQQGGAQRVAVKPPRPLLSAHAYAALVDGYMRQGDSRAAERAAQRLQSEAGLPPSRVVYNTLIRGYSKLGVVGQARALELLQEMRAAGVKPGADTYTALIVAAESLGSDMGQVDESGYSSEEEQELMQRQQGVIRMSTTSSTAISNTGSRDASFPGGAGGLHPVPAPAAGLRDASEALGSRASSSSSSNAGPGSSSSGSLSEGLTLRAPLRLAQHQQQQHHQPTHPQLQQQQDRARVGNIDSSASGPAPSYLAQTPGLGSAAQSLGGRVGQYVRQLHAEGLPPDAALLTALMMVHARAGRYSLALQVFEELRSSPHAAVDVAAWSAVTAVHAMQGNLQEAEAAAQQAASLAGSQGRAPPVTAFGALVRAYVRQSNLPPALAALKRFMVLGGRPSTRLLDPVVLLCLRKGDRQAAAKVVRAAELTGVAINKDKYRAWFARGTGREGSQSPSPSPSLTGSTFPEARSPGSSSSPGSPSGAGAGAGATQAGGQGSEEGAVVVEKLKWWFGLPNSYYSSDWRSHINGGSSNRGSPHQYGSGGAQSTSSNSMGSSNSVSASHETP